MTITDIIVYMKSMGYTFIDGNESNLNFIKAVPNSTFLIRAHVKDWRGPWAIDLKFLNLRHNIELRSGNFRIPNPDFKKYEEQLFSYIEICLKSHI